jgi:hypothetical protein
MMAARLPIAALLLLLAVPAAGTGAGPAGTVQQQHWAWQPPVRPHMPPVRGRTWVNNPIDVFVLAKLEAADLAPAPPAGRERLIRRASLDLIGLPPAPAEIDAFVADRSGDAWRRVVDRLLASPHYGERWGRHWLDLARFAESNGFEFDEVRPDAWRYRDYVIDSFNADKPYDRFVAEQLAGDELWPGDPQALVATGFNLLGPDMTDASDQAARRQHTLNDMTDTAGLVFLGMTLACARCHDHKFEPIPQSDYYRLQAFFAPAEFRLDLPVAAKDVAVRQEAAAREYAALVQPIEQAIRAVEEPYRQEIHERKLARLADDARAAHETPPEKRTAVQRELVGRTARLLAVAPAEITAAMNEADKARRARLQAELKQFDDRRPPPLPTAMGMRQSPQPPPKTFVLERGELNSPADEVQPGFPSVLEAIVRSDVRSPASPRSRASLATWITRPDNPLTARVLVNRIWQHHFGRGIVATASDFGLRGERPTHPQLLDWLAVEFVEAGWSIKHVHRLILESATYQQSAEASPAALAKGPENRLLSRWPRLRLEGEVVRDSLLAASGRLNRTMGGRGVFPPLPEEALRGTKAWTASTNEADHVRRSVYVFARRNLRYPFLEAFDLPDSNLSCPQRERSMTAPQALALLNSAEVAQAAEELARRVEREAGTGPERIALACRLALGRRPTENELRLADDFLKQSPLSEFCRALLNVNEFVYLD